VVKAIRYNNPSLAPLTLPPAQMELFYAAYCALGELIASAEFQVIFKRHPGALFLVDNERVLDRRTAFSSAGNRHWQGCYADRDGLFSTFAGFERRLNPSCHSSSAAPWISGR
jgi:gamma-butyrobetaine dioxygenase